MVVTRLYFKIDDNEGAETSYTIDLAKALSQHHRRLVRQKQIFTVYGGIYQDTGVGGSPTNAYFSTAPHYWVTKRSINRIFKAWKKQLSDAMTNVNDINAGTSHTLRTGKYSDFKVHLDDKSVTTYLNAKDASDTDLPSGEWDFSTLTMPREDIDVAGDGSTFAAAPSDQFDIKICGDHTSSGSGTSLNYSRVSAIKSWLDSRPIKDDNQDSPNENPNTINDPITRMFLTGDSDEDEKIIEAINSENDIPPYDLDKLSGAAGHSGHGADLQMQCIVSPDSNSGVASIAGFQAICGLVRIHVTGDTGSSGAVLILDVESNGVAF